MLRRALDYPYPAPDHPYLFVAADGSAIALDEVELRQRAAGRHAVLAAGSNASPYQLARKFPGTDWGEIPVFPVAVGDHDVVYAARLARYGALPATIVRCAGTTVHLHLVHVDDEQLERLDETEGVGTAYESVELEVSPGSFVQAYRSLAGPLLVDDEPVALAAKAADDRRFPARTEEEMLAWLARREGATVHQLIEEVVVDDDRLRALNDRLALLAG